ncbi:MAG: hypothetical protein WCV85_06445 [Patescibacteria group bacterium]|jgi:uncharacterized membrane protein
MKRQFTYVLIAIFSAAGAALSGYLSYINLWGTGCQQAALSCGNSGPVMIFGLPNCIYGFGMFTAVFVLSIAILLHTTAAVLPKIVFWFSVVGTAFALGLVVYEYGWLKETGIPACVYGLIFYALIFILAIMHRKQANAVSTPPLSPNA